MNAAPDVFEHVVGGEVATLVDEVDAVLECGRQGVIVTRKMAGESPARLLASCRRYGSVRGGLEIAGGPPALRKTHGAAKAKLRCWSEREGWGIQFGVGPNFGIIGSGLLGNCLAKLNL